MGANLSSGSTAIIDGWSGYARLKDVKHEPKIVGPMAAHVLLPWIHRVFANAKRWAMGVYHRRTCSATWMSSSSASIGQDAASGFRFTLRHRNEARTLHTKC